MAHHGHCHCFSGVAETEWRKMWLSCKATFIRCDNMEECFWHASRIRENIGASFDTMYYSTVT